MSDKKKEKTTKSTLIVWPIPEYKLALSNAVAAKLDFSPFVRASAAGAKIRIPRGLPLEDRRLLAAIMGALNENGAALKRMADALEAGEVPFQSVLDPALFTAIKAADQIRATLKNLQPAAGDVLSELERP